MMRKWYRLSRSPFGENNDNVSKCWIVAKLTSAAVFSVTEDLAFKFSLESIY